MLEAMNARTRVRDCRKARRRRSATEKLSDERLPSMAPTEANVGRPSDAGRTTGILPGDGADDAALCSEAFSPAGRDECECRWRQKPASHRFDKGLSIRPAARLRVGDPIKRMHLWYIAVAVCIGMLSPAVIVSSSECTTGLSTPGRTWPPGDITLEYGSPLRIQCILNETIVKTTYPGKNASDLVFFRNQKEMDPAYVTIVNSTTIQLDLVDPPPSHDMYICKLRLNKDANKDFEGVCINDVVIGFKPQPVDDFLCISKNWQNMTCTWKPQPNYITTKYSLAFKLAGRNPKFFPCPEDKDNRPLPPNSCFWSAATDPIYRQPYDYYTFYLTGENALGSWTGSFRYHHYAHVIPAKPANLTVLNKTLDSALLQWGIAFPMQNFPVGLFHRITCQNQWDGNKLWKVINLDQEPTKNVPKVHYNLTDLKYANTGYEVRVSMRSAVAVGEDKWGEYSVVTFRTPPRLPFFPPRTDIGSFEITDNNLNRDVYIYWQKISPWQENGDKFRYEVTSVEENGRKVSLAPNETTRTYAKFRGIRLNSNYKFEIVSSNELGDSPEASKIFLPSKAMIPKEPMAFTKIAFDDGLYELSWKPPLGSNQEIVNYTIFWCDNERDRPYQCTGYLDWVHMPRTTTLYNMTVPDPKKVYQFAIAANTEHASSGMVWASCTVIHNKVMGKMKSVWINRIGSDFIEVGWKLECSDRIGIVEAFKIYYCPIVSPHNLNCKGEKLNTTIDADPTIIRGVVSRLKPYTTYLLAVAVITKNGEGQHSDPLYNTTLEAAPSMSPTNVSATNVTNTTMLVEWKEPGAMNGVLRYYIVYYNEVFKKVEAEETSLWVTDLDGYTNYSISVAACTVSCSEKSKPIYRLTRVGVPGDIPRPYSPPQDNATTGSNRLIRWYKPTKPAGPVNYYQYIVGDGDIQNVTRNEIELDCKIINDAKSDKFLVRAVNIADDEHLVGPWSKPLGIQTCSGSPIPMEWLVVIWVVGGLAVISLIGFSVFASKRLWFKCKAMQDVEVKLPPGLASNVFFASQKLLQKAPDQHIRQSSTDSSGCSSGQESVTSSLTAESRISSDSGADVGGGTTEPSATETTTPGGPTWEKTRLRQRLVSGRASAAATASMSSTSSASSTASGAVRRNEASYAKIAANPDAGDTASTENLIAETTTPSPTIWSAGLIGMPNADNPVGPKDSSNLTQYSVVSALPDLEGEDKVDDAKEAANNPYVTMAMLEKKKKQPQKSTKALAESLATKLTQPSPMPTPTPVAVTECKPAAPKPAAPKPPASMLQVPKPQASKPYVTIESINELVNKAPPPKVETGTTAKSYVAVAAREERRNSMPTSVFKMLQESNDEGMNSSASSTSSSSSSSTNPLCWPNVDEAEVTVHSKETPMKPSSGYVTLPEKTMEPRVAQQRLQAGKPAPQSQPSDGQYSKVAVAPTAIH